MHEKTSYVVSALSGVVMIVWMIWKGEDPLKSLGAGLMISSAMFLFVGFFAKPKYEFGQFTIMQNAKKVQDKLEELEEMTHHKQIYGQRIREGIENIPTKGRLQSMLKPELVQICIGLGLPSDPDLYTKRELIESIVDFQEAKK